MKNVLCIKWGSKYSADYVNNLYSMVERHLSLSHRFVCLCFNRVAHKSNIRVIQADGSSNVEERPK